MATSICNFHRKLACKEFKSLLFDEIVNRWSKNDRFYPCKVQLTVRFRIILHAWFRVYQISKSQTNGHSISWFTQHEISARWDYKNTQIWPCYPKSVDTNCQILILDKKTLILILLNKKTWLLVVNSNIWFTVYDHVVRILFITWPCHDHVTPKSYQFWQFNDYFIF